MAKCLSELIRRKLALDQENTPTQRKARIPDRLESKQLEADEIHSYAHICAPTGADAGDALIPLACIKQLGMDLPSKDLIPVMLRKKDEVVTKKFAEIETCLQETKSLNEENLTLKMENTRLKKEMKEHVESNGRMRRELEKLRSMLDRKTEEVERLENRNSEMKVKGENVEDLLNKVVDEMKEGRTAQVELCGVRLCFFFVVADVCFLADSKHGNSALRTVSAIPACRSRLLTARSAFDKL